MNPIVASVVSMFIRLILKSDVFKRVENQVLAWSQKEISGAAKRNGILDSLEVIGLTGAEWAFRIAIELTIGKLVDFDAKVQPQAVDFEKAIGVRKP